MSSNLTTTLNINAPTELNAQFDETNVTITVALANVPSNAESPIFYDVYSSNGKNLTNSLLSVAVSGTTKIMGAAGS
jgi:hypothetical protein